MYVIMLRDKSLFVGIDGASVISTTDSTRATMLQDRPYVDYLVQVLDGSTAFEKEVNNAAI